MFEEEGTLEDKDNEAKKNEDEEGMIEEIEEHKEIVSYPYPCFENSYDILGLDSLGRKW